MTDRHAGYVVVLAEDIREDDAESTLTALRMSTARTASRGPGARTLIGQAGRATAAGTRGWPGCSASSQANGRAVLVADAYAVITPAGELSWHTLADTAVVEAMVGGAVAPGALDTVTVAAARIPGRGPLKCLASDIALLFPGDYPPNPLAGAVLRELSGGRLSQPWAGSVALVEYAADPRTGEVLWPGEMSPRWVEMVNRAVRRAQGTPGGKAAADA